MHYAMLLKPHANVRYRQSLQKLALKELECLLEAWNLDAKPAISTIQSETFLTFETDHMTAAAWHAISGHSAICLATELRGDALKPLLRSRADFLPDDLPQVLKYKGKTNTDFTFMLLHCAKAASVFAKETTPLTVLDPLCGKATTLFCALQEGDNAVGIEIDLKALTEADTYFERFLKLHRVKHKKTLGSQTLPKGGNAKMVTYALFSKAEAVKQADSRSLLMINGDAARLSDLVRAESCHLIVSDLPYGIQHAPKEGKGISSLEQLARSILPGCLKALKHGGAVAFSFNANTLPKETLVRAMRDANLTVLTQAPYDDFAHWVEQAVDRDVVIGCKP